MSVQFVRFIFMELHAQFTDIFTVKFQQGGTMEENKHLILLTLN